MIKKIVYGPPDWFVDRFDSHDRRAMGFWIFIFSVIGTLFFGRAVLYVTIITVLGLIPMFTSETPVEEEG